MIKKLIHAVMALALAAGMAFATYQPAEARVRGGVVAGAIVGGVVAGALIAGASRRAHAHGCYDGPKRCEWRNRHCYENRWGETVCRGGEYRCWRPRICD